MQNADVHLVCGSTYLEIFIFMELGKCILRREQNADVHLVRPHTYLGIFIFTELCKSISRREQNADVHLVRQHTYIGIFMELCKSISRREQNSTEFEGACPENSWVKPWQGLTMASKRCERFSCTSAQEPECARMQILCACF